MKANIRRNALIALIAAAILLLLCGLIVGCNKEESGKEQEEKVASGITLEMRNAKTEFFVGERFSTLGLGIRVTYTDGTNRLVLADGKGVDVLVPSLDEIGRKKVAVQYSGFIAEYTVTVSRIDGIALNVTNARRAYTVGDEFSTDGISASVKITTLNELEEEVSRYEPLSVLDYTVEAPDLSAPGKKAVTVSYTAGLEYSETFDVYVTPSVAANSILTFEGDGKLVLYVTERAGGSSATADGEAKGWYLLVRNDGTFDMYEAGIRYKASTGSDTFEGTVQTALRDGRLVATIDGKDYTANIDVYRTVVFGWERQIVGVQVEAPSESREYLVGATFTSEGLKAMAAYSDGSLEELAGGSFTVEAPSEASMNEIGVKTVNGIYKAEDGTEMPFSYQIFCIPDVPWETNKLDFGYDVNGSGATLELFVTERTASHEDGAYWGTSDQNVKGWLLVRNSDGTFEMYEYEYYLAWDVSSHPYPNGDPEEGVSPEGVSSRVPAGGEQYGDNLVIEIFGKTFVATDNNLWHLIVIGWQ